MSWARLQPGAAAQRQHRGIEPVKGSLCAADLSHARQEGNARAPGARDENGVGLCAKHLKQARQVLCYG